MPAGDRIKTIVEYAHESYSEHEGGQVADYIPQLANADPSLFGITVADASGGLYSAGDADVAFSIQSISKAFVYALVGEALGHNVVREHIGVNNTGLSFNSVMAIELNDGHPMNPMVNAGAIATTSFMPGDTSVEQWENIRTGMSRFAGRSIELDGAVYRSEIANNQRNKALARLLESYHQITGDPMDAVDVYTRQCSLLVTTRDLAVMGATLSAGGINPVTGARVVSPDVCRDTLAVLASTGLYERSGDWLFEVGLPAKSGVSGGIVAIAPGKGAIGTFSPLLDSAGNSIRGQQATAHLSRALGLNVFASNVDSARSNGDDQ